MSFGQDEKAKFSGCAIHERTASWAAAAASFNRQVVRVAIRHDVADAAHFADRHAVQMRDVRDGRAFHAFDRAAGPSLRSRAQRCRCRCTTITVTNGTRRCDGKYLHRNLVEERSRRFDNRESQRLHVEESRRARRAEVAVALALGAHDVADLKAGRGIGAADAADDDRARAGLREEERDGMSGVDGSDARANDRHRRALAVESLLEERRLELRRRADEQINHRSYSGYIRPG